MSRRSGIVAIVEGPGDKKAVPGLVRNTLSSCNHFETPCLGSYRQEASHPC